MDRQGPRITQHMGGGPAWALSSSRSETAQSQKAPPFDQERGKVSPQNRTGNHSGTKPCYIFSVPSPTGPFVTYGKRAKRPCSSHYKEGGHKRQRLAPEC